MYYSGGFRGWGWVGQGPLFYDPLLNNRTTAKVHDLTFNPRPISAPAWAYGPRADIGVSG